MRRMNQGDPQGQALAPAGGKLAGQVIFTAGQAHLLHDRLDGRPVTDAVHPGIKTQVLPDGQVIIDGKLLRHVAAAGAD